MKENPRQPITPQQKAWITRLRPELPRFFPHEARHLDLRPSGPPQLHSHSRIFPFSILADGLPITEIMVKVPQGRQGVDVQIAGQALRLLEQIFAEEPHLHVPRALGQWQDPPALIMSKANGDPLVLRLKDCRNWAIETGCQLAQHFVEQAGRWLALLHQAPAPTWAQPAPTPVQELEELLARLTPLGIDPLDEKRIRQQLAVLENEKPEEYTSPLHGEYALRNIFCQTPHDITVLDTTLSWYGNPARDIGAFLAAVRFIDKWHLFGGEMAYTSAVIRQTEQKFLAGYKNVRPLPPAEQINAYAGLQLLKYWLEYAHQQQTRNIAGLRTLIMRRINQHFVRAIL